MRALEVHFQLMQRLPVRTVESRRQFDAAPFQTLSTRRGGRPRAEEVVDLNRKIWRLRASGLKLEEIQAVTGAAPSTISRHLKGRLTTVAKATKPRR